MTHYEVLGVPQTASAADVRRAFLALARRFHPDVHVLADAATQRRAAACMRAVNDAWAVLGDAGRRASYDAELRRAPAAGCRRAPPVHPAGGTSSGARGWTHAEAAPAAGPADWRRHASPGPALSRPAGRRVMAVVPAASAARRVLLVGAERWCCGLPELASLAVAVGIVAALAFVAAPILAMKEARRAQRRPRR